jgi:hypothetical protein
MSNFEVENNSHDIMKRNKVLSVALATLILTSSCGTSYQAAGGVTGAMIGGQVGEAIGFLTGHGPFRGENSALGNLVGMGVGAVLGVGIASQIERNEQAANTQTYDAPYEDYQTRGGAYMGAAPSVRTNISPLNYMDGDGDGYLSKGETIEIEGFITNTTREQLNNIVIYLSTDNNKNCSISPSLTTSLEPGQRIRYTGRIHCKKAKKNQSVSVRLNVAYADKTSTSNPLTIGMR